MGFCNVFRLVWGSVWAGIGVKRRREGVGIGLILGDVGGENGERVKGGIKGDSGWTSGYGTSSFIGPLIIFSFCSIKPRDWVGVVDVSAWLAGRILSLLWITLTLLMMVEVGFTESA